MIEPLATIIRSNSHIRGFKLDTTEHKLSLFADDILLYILDPDHSVPHLLHTIREFGQYSGYKINLHKSNAIFLHMTPTEKMLSLSGFNPTPKGFKYLGIFITPELHHLQKENYITLLSKVKFELSKWTFLPLSLLGRIHLIKMNILPRFLFLFQMLPCFLPDEFFKSINNCLSRFIWRNKKPRISLATLMRPEALGGLDLPNLQLYFWAAQIRNMISWIMMRHESMWVNIEAKLVDPLPLSALPFINHPEKIKKIDRWFTVAHSLLSWKKCRKKMGIPSALTVYSPIFSNPDLKSISFLNTKEWIHSGIAQFKDVLNADLKIKSFMELKLQYDLQDIQFFKYLQLRSVITALW